MADDRNIGVDEPALDDAALEALAMAHATPPPPGLRRRLLAEARRDATRRQGPSARVPWRMVGAVAAMVALALAGLLTREMRRGATQATELAALARGNQELAAQLAAQERTLAGLRESLAAQAQVLRVLGGPRTLTASLAPTPEGRGSGRVLVDAASGEAAVVLAGLGPAPAGLTYELWAIRGDRPPEPAGLVGPGGTEAIATAAKRLERPGEVTAFAVSIEPASGSPSPTGPIVLAGPVTG